MDRQRTIVRDRNGIEAAIAPDIVDQKRVLIELEDGRKLLLPRSSLHWNEEQGYSVGFSFEGLEEVPAEEQGLVIPVLQERAVIHKHEVERGRVLFHKRVEEREEVVDTTATVSEVQVERVQINEFVDEPPPVRHEGDTMIVSLVEEMLVIEKRLVLREEVRITQVTREEPRQEKVRLRSEYVEVERKSQEEQTPPVNLL